MSAGLLFALTALALGGCGSRKSVTSPLAPAPGATESVSRAGAARPSAAVASPGHLEGTLGPGTTWTIDVPEGWNGDLAVWLHGYTPPQQPVEPPAFGPYRDALLAGGYAVIASSFSANGYAIKEGVIQSHQLRGVFVANVAQPRHTYLVGVSLGGLIGALMAEKYPDQYNGALLVSGIVAGTDDELTYVGDVRVLFDAVYPGVLPGTLYDVPEGTNVNAVLGAALAAIQADPTGVGVIAALARVTPEFSNSSELVQTILTVLGFQLQGAGDIIARTHDHSFFDNASWTYAGPVPQPVADQVNATVARYESTPDARAYMAHYGEPSGDLHIPVITLHNQYDPVVPFKFETGYRTQVELYGATGFLVQRTVDGYGHVAITPSELAASFGDLVLWAEDGVVPSP